MVVPGAAEADAWKTAKSSGTTTGRVMWNVVPSLNALGPYVPAVLQTMIDEHQLVEVFLNILTNAEKAIHKASGIGQIDVCTHRLPNRDLGSRHRNRDTRYFALNAAQGVA